MKHAHKSLRKEIFELSREFDLDPMLFIGYKEGLCELVTQGSSATNFAIILELLIHTLKNEKEYLNYIKDKSFLGALLVDKLYEADYLIGRYISDSKKEIIYN